ncbi:MAG: hypothetical protein OXG27_11785, partial [Chloroflexi bacterium]|nr:hypothetical protein [Chloroflexota bacterium]
MSMAGIAGLAVVFQVRREWWIHATREQRQPVRVLNGVWSGVGGAEERVNEFALAVGWKKTAPVVQLLDDGEPPLVSGIRVVR